MLQRTYTRRHALQAAGAGAAGVALASALPHRSLAAGPDPITPVPGISGSLQAWDWSDAPSLMGEQAQAEFYTKYFPSLYKDLQIQIDDTRLH